MRASRDRQRMRELEEALFSSPPTSPLMLVGNSPEREGKRDLLPSFNENTLKVVDEAGPAAERKAGKKVVRGAYKPHRAEFESLGAGVLLNPTYPAGTAAS
ncbi:hypothetical protein CYMTET_24251 [Cymbomonas tetramitiformis]|uniref:Uncharacterized protein n=1 Tax=Cymbomonas tetramitiformis TaxID=36881 RepID=A0AAE0FW96_9CHLO|nr:hypothetical protein CYMTET_24251 [Cymbomonas tetramitiformis]